MVEYSIQDVVIVGAGWVGRQIAALVAKSGLTVTIVDRNTDVLSQSMGWLERVHARETKKRAEAEASTLTGECEASANSADYNSGVDNWLHFIRTCESVDQARRYSDSVPAERILVIECVSEQLSLKKRVLRQCSKTFPAPAIIVSNSSYFLPSLLSQFVDGSERFAHLHFHVPVHAQSIVDLVGCDATQPEVLRELDRFACQLGLQTLHLRKEHPGYVFNWMLQALLKSALELAARDVVDPEDIDRSWKTVTGMPYGPFGMMDQIGLDVIEQVLANARWSEDLGVTSEQLIALLRDQTSRGRFGKKSGAGFYEYDPDDDLL